MQHYTLAVATRRFRNRLRSEIATQPLPPTRLRRYHTLLAAADSTLAQVDGVLARCVECGDPVSHGVEVSAARRPVLCRRCVVTAAELLAIQTQRK